MHAPLQARAAARRLEGSHGSSTSRSQLDLLPISSQSRPNLVPISSQSRPNLVPISARLSPPPRLVAVCIPCPLRSPRSQSSDLRSRRCDLGTSLADVISALPDAAGVVLGARDDRVSFVVECRGEDLVRVPLEHLQAVAALHVPDAAGAVTARGDDLVALRVERNLGDLALVPDEDRLASARHCVVDAGRTVGRGRHQLAASRVESHIEDLIVVPLQGRSMEPEMHSSAEKSNCVLEISPRWPERVWRQRPLVVSQTFVEWSKDPVMILPPSVLKLSETISAVWPSNEQSSTPLCTSHSFAVESMDPVATTWPCGSKERQTISVECPLRV